MTGELSRERVILDPCPRHATRRHRPRPPSGEAPGPAPDAADARADPGLDRRSPTGDGPSTGEGRPVLEALLGGLNPEQLRAVTHGDGPLLVVAGAGTGKTQVVTRRIAWLIATRRARPSEILALTFTDKAAAEMQARVDGLVPYGYTDTAISTFHAFGDRLIREYAFELGLRTGRPRPVPARGRDLPARAPVRLRARAIPPARRPDPLPRRARDPVQPAQGRGHRSGDVPRRGRSGGDRSGAHRRSRRGGRADRRDPRGGTGGGRVGRAAARAGPCLRPVPGPARRGRLHRLRRPGRARPAAGPPVGRRPDRDPAALPVHPRRRVPGHEPRAGRAGRAHRRRRTGT